MASGDDEKRPADHSDDSAPAHTRRRVRRVFDRIAGHFSATREHPWPEVESFLADRPGEGRAATALDLGCGNGRHAELLADHADRVVGIDASRGLLREARARGCERGFDIDLLQGDAVRLPLADGSVDLAVYVATLHHLPTAADRQASLAELARVLAPDGRALVSTWSTAHDRFEGEPGGECGDDDGDVGDPDAGFDTTIDWTLPGGETVPRFYHIYAPAEFRAMLEASPLAVASFEVSSGNCYAVVGPSSP